MDDRGNLRSIEDWREDFKNETPDRQKELEGRLLELEEKAAKLVKTLNRKERAELYSRTKKSGQQTMEAIREILGKRPAK